MVFFQRDHDVAIGCPDGSVGEVLGIHRTVRQPDVVQDIVQLRGWNLLADILFDQVAETGHLLDAQARGYRGRAG